MQSKTLAFPQVKTSSALIVLLLLFFFIPIEHKYDKLLRFYSLTLIPSGLQLPEHFDKKIYFYLSDLAALFLFGIGLSRLKQRFFEPKGLLLAAIFFLATLSILFSPLAHYPIPYTRLLQLFAPFALFCFLASGLIAKERLFPVFSWSFFASGLLQAAISTCQYFTQRSLGLRFFGEQPFNAYLGFPGGRRWLLDKMLNSSDTPLLIYRAMGTMPHPNILGGLLVLSLLITGYLFQERRSLRLYLAPCYLLQLSALAMTYSRAAIFAYAIATLLWFIRTRCKWEAPSLIAVSLLLVGALFSEQYLYRGGIVNYTPQARASDQERLHYQNIAVRMIESHPLTGVGYGQFSLRAPSFGGSPEQINAVHNIYLLLATETGLLSLAIFLSWIGMLLFAARGQASSETQLLLSAFCAFLFIGLFDLYPLVSRQGALLFFGTAGCLASMSRREIAAARTSLQSP